MKTSTSNQRHTWSFEKWKIVCKHPFLPNFVSHSGLVQPKYSKYIHVWGDKSTGNCLLFLLPLWTLTRTPAKKGQLPTWHLSVFRRKSDGTTNFKLEQLEVPLQKTQASLHSTPPPKVVHCLSLGYCMRQFLVGPQCSHKKPSSMSNGNTFDEQIHFRPGTLGENG